MDRRVLAFVLDQVEAKAEERLNGNGHFPHYMGAVLVIPRGSYSFGRIEVLDVVDGQQRLTTFQSFLAALPEATEGDSESPAFRRTDTNQVTFRAAIVDVIACANSFGKAREPDYTLHVYPSRSRV